MASVISATTIAIWTMKRHHLDPLEQHSVQVGGIEMMVTVLDRSVELDPAAPDRLGGEVEEVFVDHPLDERLGRHQHQRRQEVAPGPLPDVDPRAQGERARAQGDAG